MSLSLSSFTCAHAADHWFMTDWTNSGGTILRSLHHYKPSPAPRTHTHCFHFSHSLTDSPSRTIARARASAYLSSTVTRLRVTRRRHVGACTQQRCVQSRASPYSITASRTKFDFEFVAHHSFRRRHRADAAALTRNHYPIDRDDRRCRSRRAHRRRVDFTLRTVAQTHPQVRMMDAHSDEV